MFDSKPYFSKDVILYLEDMFNASAFVEANQNLSKDEFSSYLLGVRDVIDELKNIYKEDVCV